MPRDKNVDLECIHASNPFHKCADYCTADKPPGGADHRFGRALSGLLVPRSPGSKPPVGRAKSSFLILHRAPNSKTRLLARAKTDLDGGTIKEGDRTEQGRRLDPDATAPRPSDGCADEGGQSAEEKSAAVKGEGGLEEGGRDSAVKEEGSLAEAGEPSKQPSGSIDTCGLPALPPPNDKARPRPKPRLGRAISGFLIQRPQRSKARIERARSDLNGGRAKEDDQKAEEFGNVDTVCVDPACSCNRFTDYCSERTTEMARPTEEGGESGITRPTEEAGESVVTEKDEGNTGEEDQIPDTSVEQESIEESGDQKDGQLSGLDPSDQFPPLDPIRLEDEPATPVTKKRAGWSITRACMTRICNYLTEHDPIEHEAIEILLASMEKSEKDTGYSFENWRAAVRKAVAEAKRFGSESTAILKESIMAERERALTEAHMSLNDEQIRLSKMETVLKDQFEARKRIIVEIDVLKRECSSLRKQLVIKERDLDARKKDLKAVVEEHACQQQGLASIREAVSRKEEVVSRAGAALEMAEADAVAERDRLCTILRQSITQLQEFEISHRHPDLAPY